MVNSKITEAGTIPDDWKVVKVQSVADVKTGPFGSTLHADDYVLDGTPIITVEHLGEQGITRQNLPLVSNEDTKRLKSYVLKSGDIAFSRVGSVDRNAYVTDAEEGWLFSGRILRLRPTASDVDSRYLGYYFKLDETKNRIRNVAVGQTMASLNTKIMKNFSVALPPTVNEQTAIATALSDIDALIDGLRRLIAKKKNIRQGTMQELLTGKRRLPGFEGEWEEQPLSKYGFFVRGVSYNPSTDISLYDNDYVKHLLRANNIIDGQLNLNDVIYVDCHKVSEEQMLQYGDIVIAMSSGSIVAIGKNAQYKNRSNKYCVGAFCAIYRSNVGDYISYLLQSSMFREKLKNILAGTSINNLNVKELGKMNFLFPQDGAEWRAICDSFNDMNEEISSLESKLQKYENIKSGMMDKLLTGQIRLV